MRILNLNNIMRLAVVSFVVFVALVLFLSQRNRIEGNSLRSLNISAESRLLDAKNNPKGDLKSQVNQHNTKNDCWIIYESSAYNITGYFGLHPGGDALLLTYCGKDATEAFNSKNKNPPNPHSQSAKQLLSQFLIQ